MQGIVLHDFEPRLIWPALPEMFGESGIQFDGDYAGGVRQKVLCESAFAGTDLDHRGRVVATGGLCDPLEDSGACKEVLAEPLARHLMCDRRFRLSNIHIIRFTISL